MLMLEDHPSWIYSNLWGYIWKAKKSALDLEWEIGMWINERRVRSWEWNRINNESKWGLVGQNSNKIKMLWIVRFIGCRNKNIFI